MELTISTKFSVSDKCYYWTYIAHLCDATCAFGFMSHCYINTLRAVSYVTIVVQWFVIQLQIQGLVACVCVVCNNCRICYREG